MNNNYVETLYDGGLTFDRREIEIASHLINVDWLCIGTVALDDIRYNTIV